MPSSFTTFGRHLADALYPPVCLICSDVVPSTGLCNSCHQKLLEAPGEKCKRCSAKIGQFSQSEEGCHYCKTDEFDFKRVICFGSYESVLRDCVIRLKTLPDESLVRHLVSLWHQTSKMEFSQLPIDIIVPVPLHWLRRFRRGHNDAFLIASELSRLLMKPLRTDLLWRSRHLPPQTSLSATERRKRIRTAFQARSRGVSKESAILLVDDVMTTGGTLQGCAKALQLAGFHHINAAVFCRAHG